MKRERTVKRLTPSQWILSLLILFTLCFIWSNSMRDAVSSGEQSGFFSNLFQQLFDVTREPFRFLYQNLRKVAHFSEFALLGVEVAAFLSAFRSRRLYRYAGGYGGCVIAAVIDEGIQLFTPGRVAAVTDVGIDAAGALCGMLLMLGVFIPVCRLFKKK